VQAKRLSHLESEHEFPATAQATHSIGKFGRVAQVSALAGS
jgi:hypothetical protein